MNNVLSLRTSLQMTQDEFSEYCNVSRISIARYEAGAEINRKNAVKIANACGVSIEYVIGEEKKDAESLPIAPKTIEARIVSFGMDQLPQEERERIINVLQAMYTNNPDLFKRSENDET